MERRTAGEGDQRVQQSGGGGEGGREGGGERIGSEKRTLPNMMSV